MLYEVITRQKEVFIPLVHPPGRAQVDFGEADIYLGGGFLMVPFLIMLGYEAQKAVGTSFLARNNFV